MIKTCYLNSLLVKFPYNFSKKIIFTARQQTFKKVSLFFASVFLFVFYLRNASSFFVVLSLDWTFSLQVELQKRGFVEKNEFIINYFRRRESIHPALNWCSRTFWQKSQKPNKKKMYGRNRFSTGEPVHAVQVHMF